MTSNPQTSRRGLLVDGATLLAILGLGALLLEPGVFTVDESHYLLAASAMAERGSFHIDNGYERFHAPQLLFFYTVVPDRVNELGTVSTVPPYHALLAAPILMGLGFQGLFWLNLFSFALTAVAVRRIASRLRPEPLFPIAAVVVFVLGVFGLEYALGIWPHALSQCLVAWALLALLRSADETPFRWIFGAASGLLLGIATGVRILNIVWLPALLLAGALWLRISWRGLLCHLVGWLPPLLGLAGINLVRLGTANPFTYGAHAAFDRFSPVQEAGVAVFVVTGISLVGLGIACWALRRNRTRQVLVALVAAALILVVAIPATRGIFSRWLWMAGFQFLDSSFLPAAEPLAGAWSNDLGQVFYGGVLKKGLLEAAPFLVLCPLFLLARLVGRQTSRALEFLSGVSFLTGAALPLVVSTGGLCFNPRYLLELLPGLVVLALFWMFELRPTRLALLIGAGGGLLLALPVITEPGAVGRPAEGTIVLLFSLGLATLLLLTATVNLVRRAKTGFGKALAGALAAAALLFGFTTNLGIDLSRSLAIRSVAARMLAVARDTVPDRSLLLAWEARKDVFTPLKLERDVLIGDLATGEEQLLPLLSQAGRERRLLILKNGIPDERWLAWTQPYQTKIQEKQGLQFVELVPRGAP